MDVLAEVLASGGGHRDRIVRLLGRNSVCRSDPTGRLASLTFCPQDDHQPSWLPANPYTLLGGACSMPIPARYRKWTRKSAKFAYDRDIHDTVRVGRLRCRPFCEAIPTKDIAKAGVSNEMGCQGANTHAGCSTRHFNEILTWIGRCVASQSGHAGASSFLSGCHKSRTSPVALCRGGQLIGAR